MSNVILTGMHLICGISLFETENGDTVLLATDYSDYKIKNNDIKESTVVFNTDIWGGIKVLYWNASSVIAENGTLKSIGMKMRYEESTLIKLVTKHE